MKRSKIFTMLCASTLVLGGCSGGDDETGTDGKVVEVITPNLNIKSGYSLKEPDSGTENIDVDILFTKASTNDMSFDYELVADSASGDDFSVASGTIELLAGTRSYSLPIIILGDDLDELEEVFLLKISNPVNFVIPTGSDSVAITILDEDPTPIAAFTSTTVDVLEGVGLYSVTVLLDNKSQTDISIPYNYDGLAAEGTDYTIVTPSPITIKAGELSATIDINFLDDSIPEGGEGLSIHLETPLNAKLDVKKGINDILIVIPGDISMNDTGSITFYDGVSFENTSTNAEYPNQDASSGRDIENTDDFDGHLGFSWTKLDRAGNALPSNADDFMCIKDNVTGHVWESKTSPQILPPYPSGTALKTHLNRSSVDEDGNAIPYPYDASHQNYRANNYTYFWFNEDDSTNGGSEGTAGSDKGFPIPDLPINRYCALPKDESYIKGAKRCSTANYLKVFNLLSMCGFQDWKVPDINELRSFYDYSYTQTENKYFPLFNKSANYYSSTPSADGKGAVWCLEGETGRVKFCKKQIANHVILTRGGAQ
jgi:hypothetical protein